MSEAVLISAVEAHEHSQNGDALLVCAYDSDDKFKNVHLQGAIPLSQFKANLSTTEKSKEIIFYCA